ncbi:heat shock 70 kDa protein 12A-like [Limulus polyphemus]|uniref:Heat shock 70 kDa protein 12A-like n=1 Tax=Limulus polyphemus TaxID=6850 RepID=A0ABM1T8E5_LIMPO|nr:heat shock 70 kDa protein 12A-like [Limulus polyphemus]
MFGIYRSPRVEPSHYQHLSEPIISLCDDQGQIKKQDNLSPQESPTSYRSVQNSNIYLDDGQGQVKSPILYRSVQNSNVYQDDYQEDYTQDEINECYNVNVKAPKEVIVANFHDFCQTMLSVDNVDEQNFGNNSQPSDPPRKGTCLYVTTNPKPVPFKNINGDNQSYQSKENERLTNEEQLYNTESQTIVESNSGSQAKNQSLRSEASKDEEALHSDLKMNYFTNKGKVEVTSNVVQPESSSSPHSSKIVKEMVKKMASHPNGGNDEFVLLRRYDQCSKKEQGRGETGALTSIEHLEKTTNEILQPSNEGASNRLYFTSNHNLSLMETNKGPSIIDHEAQTDNLIEEIYIPLSSKKSPSRVSYQEIENPSFCNHQTEPSRFEQTEPTNIKRLNAKFRRRTIDTSDPNQAARAVGLRRNSDLTKSLEEQDTRIEILQEPDSFTNPNVINNDTSPPIPPNTSSLPEKSSDIKSLNGSSCITTFNSDKYEADVTPLNGDFFNGTDLVDSGTSSQQQGHFVVVAIDFGTTYSGYAFSFIRDPSNIHMMRKWEGGDPGVPNQKTPTTLLLTPSGEFHSFGFSARDFYHDLDVEEAKRWFYLEKFKMTLHHQENLSLETPIEAANGKTMPAVTVFAHALRYFRTHALEELSDQTATEIVNEDIRWVVTVPAIWRQPAKQFMRAAAYEAGIGSPDHPEQLLIALEPEAASIYCRKLRMHQLVPEVPGQRRLSMKQEESLEETSALAVVETEGTRYMVVDCGGGTVDITVHELQNQQGTLKELYKATGGPYGSVGVDQEFEKLLNDIFGADFVEEYKMRRPAGYVDLMVAFEARKRNTSPFNSNPLNISLPFSFIDFYKKYKNSSVESALRKFSQKSIKWSSQGMLRLEPSAMMNLFQPTVHHIRQQIANILNNPNIGAIDYIFLVGGFAESQILQKEIRDNFSPRLKVIIPQGVSLAIVKGAVLFGLDPTIVKVRRSRMTYGVGVLNRFIHGVHPPDKLVVKDGVEWCADVFDKFVICDQSVGLGDVVIRSYTPAKAGQSCSVIHIYNSERDDTNFITDLGVKKCGSLILDLSDPKHLSGVLHRREIQTRMVFGDTEIKATALDVATGTCVKADIDFLNH